MLKAKSKVKKKETRIMPNYNDNSGYRRYTKKKEEKKICKMYDIINIKRRNIRVFISSFYIYYVVHFANFFFFFLFLEVIV